MTNTSEFLPADYEQPKSGGGYMKFKDGENRFRILSKPIIGWLDWLDKKPLRYVMQAKPKQPAVPGKAIKHFWAMIVWNYSEQAVQILEITQSSIQSAIAALIKDEDWGSPYGYDLKVIRSGKDLETTYTVNPTPQKPITTEIQEAFKNKPCDLQMLFEGLDPWDVKESATVIEDMPF